MVFCDECQKRPASVHFTKIVNNEKVERNLCEQCAREKGEYFGILNPGFSLQQLLSGLLQGDSTLQGRSSSSNNLQHCECGMTYRDFAETGRLGCEKCYTTFSDRLSPLLRRIHGSNRHLGKVPIRTGGVIRIRKDLEDLRDELKSLIAQEKYEKAAEVRDKIKELEKKILG